MTTATALAHPNIAFIKYWGDIDSEIHLPTNGSISMNLDCLYSHTTVKFDPELEKDKLIIGGEVPPENAVARVSLFLDRVRYLAGISTFAQLGKQDAEHLARTMRADVTAQRIRRDRWIEQAQELSRRDVHE